MSSEKTIDESINQQKENENVVSGDNGSSQESCTAIKEQLLRVTADFQNYKHRVEKERMQYIQIGHLSVVEKLLPIVDDVDRALDEARKKEADSAWLSGFDLIAKALYKMLDECDVRPIEQNSAFDPELHEALAQVESAEHESGAIVQTMQRGFMIGDRVLRPAKVTVAK